MVCSWSAPCFFVISEVFTCSRLSCFLTLRHFTSGCSFFFFCCCCCCLRTEALKADKVQIPVCRFWSNWWSNNTIQECSPWLLFRETNCWYWNQFNFFFNQIVFSQIHHPEVILFAYRKKVWEVLLILDGVLGLHISTAGWLSVYLLDYFQSK